MSLQINSFFVLFKILNYIYIYLFFKQFELYLLPVNWWASISFVWFKVLIHVQYVFLSWKQLPIFISWFLVWFNLHVQKVWSVHSDLPSCYKSLEAYMYVYMYTHCVKTGSAVEPEGTPYNQVSMLQIIVGVVQTFFVFVLFCLSVCLFVSLSVYPSCVLRWPCAFDRTLKSKNSLSVSHPEVTVQLMGR